MTHPSFIESLKKHQSCFLTTQIKGLIFAWKGLVWSLKVTTRIEKKSYIEGLVGSACPLNSVEDTAEDTDFLTLYKDLSLCKMSQINSNCFKVKLNSYISYNFWIRK